MRQNARSIEAQYKNLAATVTNSELPLVSSAMRGSANFLSWLNNAAKDPDASSRVKTAGAGVIAVAAAGTFALTHAPTTVSAEVQSLPAAQVTVPRTASEIAIDKTGRSC